VPIVTFYESRGKRILDLFGAIVGGVLLSPVYVVTALAIRIGDRGPSLFRQRRVGLDGEEFTFLKFRSMPVDTPNVESAEAADLVTTRVGAFIRRTSIDELPQLLNVVIGDMSLVGPRPPIPSQRDLVEARRAAGVLRLRPGLTGLAQVQGYDGMPDPEKVEWDRDYADHVTLWGDVRILLQTIRYLGRTPPRY